MDSCLYLWDLETAKPEWKSETEFALLCCDLSPDETTVITGSDVASSVTLWDLRTGKPVRIFPKLFSGTITSIKFSPDGYHFAGASTDNCAKVFDLCVNKRVLTLEGDSVFITDLAWSKDGRKIGTSAMNSNVCVYDVTSGMYRMHPEKISVGIPRIACFTCCDFSTAESRFFACGSTDGRVSIWDVDKQDVIFDLMSHNESMVNDCAFSPGGDFLVTAGADGTGRIWSMADLMNTKKYRSILAEDPIVKHVSGITMFSTTGELPSIMKN